MAEEYSLKNRYNNPSTMEDEESVRSKSVIAFEEIYKRIRSKQLLVPRKVEDILKDMPNPYSEGRWLTPEQIVDNLKFAVSKKDYFYQEREIKEIISDVKRPVTESSIKLESKEGISDEKLGNEEDTGSVNTVSDEILCTSARNNILKGPIWNISLRKYSTDIEHYQNKIFDTHKTSIKTPEELILKGESWTPSKPITVSFIRFLIKRIKRINPETTALLEVETRRSITYGELLSKAKRLASGLTWLGLHTGQILAIVSYNSIEAFLMILASLMIGVVVALIDSKLGVVGLGIRLRQTCPHLVFSEAGKTQYKVVKTICNLSQALQQHIPHLVINSNILEPSSAYFTFNQLLRDVDPEYPIPMPQKSDPDRPIMILFSDGENSRACLTGERAFIYSKLFVDAVMPEVFDNNSITVLFTPPLFYSPLIKSLFNHWKDGHRIVFFRGPAPEATLLTTLRKYDVFAWLTIRTPLLNLLQYPAKPRCPHLKLVAVTGIPLRISSLNRIWEDVFRKQVQIIQLYCVTEVGIVSGNSFLVNKIGSMGRLNANSQLKILEEASGLPLGPNQEGEICIKSPIMMLGYYNDPEANEKAYDSEGYIRTGDLGYYDDKGFLYVTDRVRDIIKWKNYVISPLLVEMVLAEQPEIKEAFVFGLYYAEDGELVTAAVILDPEFNDVDINMLEKRVNGLLPYSRRIRGGIHVFDEFPRHTLGKTFKEPILEEVMNRLGMVSRNFVADE